MTVNAMAKELGKKVKLSVVSLISFTYLFVF